MQYEVNQRVLAWHGPLVYEARILQVVQSEDEIVEESTFFIHYKGWKKTWDEWVPRTRLLKLDEAGVKLQKQLIAQQRGGTTSVSAGGAAKGTISNRNSGVRKDSHRGLKRGREGDDHGGSRKNREFKMDVPDPLKIILVDDWENVTKFSKLVTLPRTPTVREILAEFKEHVLALASESAPPARETLLDTILSGIQTYFDRSLGANLLYRFERNQYCEIRRRYVTGPHVRPSDVKDMSQVYGAEHLLRMIVSLPGMIATSHMDTDSVTLIRMYIHVFLKFLLQEKGRLFQAEYEQTGVHNQSRH